MQILTDPRLFTLLITALFAAGAIRYAFALDWPMTIYHACAAGLQLAVLSMGGK
ncbi:MAG TPA: hypothetical protein VJ654_02905 [Noviherbaspirillum sp.]|nr:hypothetical protein [Noviherbaspirillum sp.]